MARFGVIFDVDGTLVDSNDAHARAWVQAFAEQNILIPFGRVRPLIGMGGDKLITEITGWTSDDERALALGDRRAELFAERQLPTVRPLPGARDLVERLRALGAAVGIATSARRDELAGLLAVLGAPWLAQLATTSDDAERSKPDPDIVTAAMTRLDLPPEQMVMVGDTEYDVEAATRAGIWTIAVRSGGQPDRVLAGALAIYDGPQDLLEHLDASPIAVAA